MSQWMKAPSHLDKVIAKAIARLSNYGGVIKIKYKKDPKIAKRERQALFRAQKAYWKKSGRI